MLWTVEDPVIQRLLYVLEEEPNPVDIGGSSYTESTVYSGS